MTINGEHTSERFEALFRTAQTDRFIHIAFQQPLRTVSNAVIGEGLKWVRHFCNFHVDLNYNCSNPKEDMQAWMDELQIPSDQAAGMMTAVQLRDAAYIHSQSEHYQLFVMATAGVGNAVDITSELEPVPLRQPGTINIMVFIDGHLTDGALANALMSATEAKAKALSDMDVRDSRTGTIATGTSTDSLLIAATQRGEPTPYAGSGTELGKLVGRSVHQAVKQSLTSYAMQRSVPE